MVSTEYKELMDFVLKSFDNEDDFVYVITGQKLCDLESIAKDEYTEKEFDKLREDNYDEFKKQCPAEAEAFELADKELTQLRNLIPKSEQDKFGTYGSYVIEHQDAFFRDLWRSAKGIENKDLIIDFATPAVSVAGSSPKVLNEKDFNDADHKNYNDAVNEKTLEGYSFKEAKELCKHLLL